MKEKKKYIRRMIPCGSFDIERIESWLQDMAAEGLHQAYRKRVGCFERGEPKAVRYRVQPKKARYDDDIPDKSTRELFAEYGWDYVTELGEFYVYRSEDPNARELNTEPGIQAQAFKRLAWSSLGFNFLHYLIIFHGLNRLGSEPVRWLVTMGVVYTVGFTALMLTSIWDYVVRAVRIWSLYWKLKKHQELDHNKPWRKGAFWYRLGTVAEWALLVLWLVMALSQCTAAWTLQKPLEEFEGDPPFVTVQDLCPEGQYHQGSIWDGQNEFGMTGTLAAPVVIDWYEYASVQTPEGEKYGGFLIVDYYETAAPWIARALAEEFLRVGLKERYSEPAETPDVDLDYAAAYKSLTGKVFILCQGNTVIVAKPDETMADIYLELAVERLK